MNPSSTQDIKKEKKKKKGRNYVINKVWIFP